MKNKAEVLAKAKTIKGFLIPEGEKWMKTRSRVKAALAELEEKPQKKAPAKKVNEEINLPQIAIDSLQDAIEALNAINKANHLGFVHQIKTMIANLKYAHKI